MLFISYDYQMNCLSCKHNTAPVTVSVFIETRRLEGSRRVDWQGFTDVSVKHSAEIFRGKLSKKMKALRPFETSATTRFSVHAAAYARRKC